MNNIGKGIYLVMDNQPILYGIIEDEDDEKIIVSAVVSEETKVHKATYKLYKEDKDSDMISKVEMEIEAIQYG